MPDVQQLLIFIAAGWLLNLTPGPDVLYIVTHSLRSGARIGVVAGLGITAGCFVHVIAVAAGVGALLATSAVAFTVLKWVGAAYLLWMGVKMLLAKSSRTGASLAQPIVHQAEQSLRSVFMGGFWTNVLNPKVAIFFLAFVPQFIAPETPNKALSFVLLGILFNLNSIPINSGWALVAGWLAGRTAVVQAMHWLDRLAGTLFIAFGVKLALSDHPTR